MFVLDDFRYRADIDGLRAIAVGLVILYHAGFGFSGGYIGVDVFFVISGYLISSIIWKDLDNDKFSFSQFWERRARRIVPPLVVVSFATVIAGVLILLPSDLLNLGRAIASQAVFAGNVYHWFQSGYFAGGADEMPLLHTWSLAVEEQFYLFAPVAFWLMHRYLRRRFVVIILLVLAIIASLTVSIWGVQKFPSATFYLLPTRAWEILVGSAVAFLPKAKLNPRLHEFAALAGLGMIIIPGLVYTSSTPFPGLAALIPCLGTAILIWANSESTRVGKVLSTRAFVFVGLISYSLYLWHWPLFAYTKYYVVFPPGPELRLLLLGLSFALAALSWKYVETPFRKRLIAPTGRQAYAWAFSGMAAMLLAGILFLAAQGFPTRFSDEELKLASAASDMEFINELTPEDVRSGKLVPIGDLASPQTVLVWGDSHAMAAMPAFDALLRERGIGGGAATHSAVAPVLGWSADSKFGLGQETVPFNDSIFEYVRLNQTTDVVLIASWSGYSKESSLNSETFGPSLVHTARSLMSTGSRVWLMLQVPEPGFPVPKMLYRNANRLDDVEQSLSSVADPGLEDGLQEELRKIGVVVLDPSPAFWDSARQRYLVQMDGVPIYRDGNHLSANGARAALLPFLRQVFVPMRKAN